MTRERIAGLVDVVFDTAERDEIARQILVAAAHDLAEMVATLSLKLKLLDGEFPLALTGGVLLHQTGFRELIVERLSRLHASPGSVLLITEPARGAVAMARTLCGAANR